jgi:hypothetical protein
MLRLSIIILYSLDVYNICSMYGVDLRKSLNLFSNSSNTSKSSKYTVVPSFISLCVKLPIPPLLLKLLIDCYMYTLIFLDEYNGLLFYFTTMCLVGDSISIIELQLSSNSLSLLPTKPLFYDVLTTLPFFENALEDYLRVEL